MESSLKLESGFDLSDLPKDLLVVLQQVASKVGITRIALVGGAVRDGLLHRAHLDPVRGLPDLDLVVEGSAVALAEALREHFGSERLPHLLVHGAYGTVEIAVDGILFDLATARQETYAAPGHNPQVIEGHLEQDLARRDFTVNAMALELPGANLLDLHGGWQALALRQLAFLHSGSVRDDPTRVVRGARYAARLDFELAPEALGQVRSTLQAWPWTWRLGDAPELAPPALATRLRMELELLLEREPWEMAIAHLHDWGAMVLLDERLQAEPHWRRRLRWACRLGLPLLTALIAAAADPLATAARLQLPQQQQRLLAESAELQILLASQEVAASWSKWSPACWCKVLEAHTWRPEAVALTVCLGVPMWRPLLRWWGRWRHVKSPVTAQTLIEQGWRPGPALGAELQRLRLEQVNKLVALS